MQLSTTSLCILHQLWTKRVSSRCPQHRFQAASFARKEKRDQQMKGMVNVIPPFIQATGGLLQHISHRAHVWGEAGRSTLWVCVYRFICLESTPCKSVPGGMGSTWGMHCKPFPFIILPCWRWALQIWDAYQVDIYNTHSSKIIQIARLASLLCVARAIGLIEHHSSCKSTDVWLNCALSPYLKM